MTTLCSLFVVLILGAPQARPTSGEPIYDEQIEVLQRVPLDYPIIAHSARIEGVVVIEISVGPDGAVVNTVTLGGQSF